MSFDTNQSRVWSSLLAVVLLGAVACSENQLPASPTEDAGLGNQSSLDGMERDAPAMDVDKWYQGEASMSEGTATLLVFWEQW